MERGMERGMERVMERGMEKRVGWGCNAERGGCVIL